MALRSQRVRQLATVSVVFIFLVIIAGSVVRATGSGMGCPDWPQCFGYTVPPYDIETLTWRAGKAFKAGQMILHEGQFWVANENVITSEVFNSRDQWVVFDRHDYTVFNPVHTWIEFINRLIGALSGLPILLLAAVSLWKVRTNVLNAVLSVGVLFLLLFEAWLGKLVVDGNLVPNQITLHMMGSVAIVLLLLALRARNTEGTYSFPAPIKWGLWVLLSTVVVQIFLGTQLRELVDHYLSSPDVSRLELVPTMSELMPKLHRSFAWVVLIATTVLYYVRRAKKTVIPGFQPLVFAVLLEWAIGVALYFLGLPKAMQPLHLVLSIGILASVSYPLFLSLRKENR